MIRQTELLFPVVYARTYHNILGQKVVFMTNNILRLPRLFVKNKIMYVNHINIINLKSDWQLVVWDEIYKFYLIIKRSISSNQP